MLIRTQLQSPTDRQKLLNEFAAQEVTWVVSDLKSKLALQEKVLDSQGFINEEVVLRASELWRKIFFRLHPDKALITQDLSLQIISQHLKSSELEWARTTGAAQKLFEFMTQFSGVLSHKQGHDLLGDWYRQNPESYVRWGEWYTEAAAIWKELEDRHVFPQPWIAGLLCNDNLDSLVERGIWNRSLIVDLGPDLNSFEAEIFIHLSRYLDIHVLEPVHEEVIYDRLFAPYQAFHIASLNKERFSVVAQPQAQAKRFATMLSEVKEATAQVRKWLDSGIKIDRIGVVAPDIKVYRRALQRYLSVEGIPCSLENSTTLSDIPSVSRWMADLRLRVHEINSEDLEQSLYSQDSPLVKIDFERFRSLYSRIYGNEDLDRSMAVKEIWLKKTLEATGFLSKKEFISQAITFWPIEADITFLEKCIRNLYQDCPESIKLSASEWVNYLQGLATRTDIIVEQAGEGIHCISLDSAEDLNLEALFFLGMSDSDLRYSPTLRLDPGELTSLSQMAGFVFPNTDSQRLEFKARWLLKSQKEVVLSFPSTDFNGDRLTPSLIWMEHALKSSKNVEEISPPSLTRWDELQTQNVSVLGQERQWTEEHANLLLNRLKVDLGESEEVEFAKNKLSHISASSVEDYFKCPFIFASKRLFNLADLPELDLDADSSTRGRLMHKMFEKLLQPYMPSRSPEEIEKLLETAREELQSEFGDERAWIYLKSRLVDQGLRFLKFESDWRRRFPETKTVACEEPVEGYIDRNTLELSLEESKDAIKIKGFIDRIDSDSHGNLVILDYKSSDGDLRQFGSWLEKNILQLGVYSLAIESGLTQLGPHEVVGAAFYIGKTLDRSYGFRQIESGEKLLDLEASGKNKISREQKQDFYKSLKEKIKVVISAIEKGDFNPRPLDPDKCQTCQVNQLCRHSHLN